MRSSEGHRPALGLIVPALGTVAALASCVAFDALLQMAWWERTEPGPWVTLWYTLPPAAVVGALLGVFALLAARVVPRWFGTFLAALFGAGSTLAVALGADVLLLAYPERFYGIHHSDVIFTGLAGWLIFSWYLVPNGAIAGAALLAVVRWKRSRPRDHAALR